MQIFIALAGKQLTGIKTDRQTVAWNEIESVEMRGVTCAAWQVKDTETFQLSAW